MRSWPLKLRLSDCSDAFKFNDIAIYVANLYLKNCWKAREDAGNMSSAKYDSTNNQPFFNVDFRGMTILYKVKISKCLDISDKHVAVEMTN